MMWFVSPPLCSYSSSRPSHKHCLPISLEAGTSLIRLHSVLTYEWRRKWSEQDIMGAVFIVFIIVCAQDFYKLCGQINRMLEYSSAGPKLWLANLGGVSDEDTLMKQTLFPHRTIALWKVFLTIYYWKYLSVFRSFCPLLPWLCKWFMHCDEPLTISMLVNS